MATILPPHLHQRFDDVIAPLKELFAETAKRPGADQMLASDEPLWDERHAVTFLLANPRPFALSKREWAKRLIAELQRQV